MFKLKELSMMTRWLATKLVLATGFALGIAFLVSIGPLLQEILVALFDVNNATLYESVVPDGIALDRGPKRWILKAFELPWLITAIAAALLAVQMKGWQRTVIALALAVAAGLTILDTVYGTIYGHISIDEFIINGSANVLGGLIIGLVFFFVLWASLFLRIAMGLKREHQDIITAVTAATLGLGISLVLYVAIAKVLQPVEVQARVLAKLPIKGVIGKTHAIDKDGEEKNRFRFIEKRSEVGHVTLRGTQGVEWEWKSEEENTHFAATVYVVGGCFELDEVKSLAKGKPILEVTNIERIQIVVEGFIDRVAVAGRQIGLSVERGPVSPFWIDRNKSGSGVNLTEFLSGEETIYGNTAGNIEILITAFTSQQAKEGDTVNRVPRNFNLQINDENLPIVFSPLMQMDVDETLRCRILKRTSVSTTENLYENVAVGGIFAEIERTQNPRHYWVSFDGEYAFHVGSGWLRRSNIRHSDLQSVAAEELGMIIIETPIEELFVNGERYEIPIGVGFRGHGKIRAFYDEISGLTFSGTFHAAWLGAQRLNLTPWEHWSFEVKISILTTIASICGGIATLIYRTRGSWREYM